MPEIGLGIGRTISHTGGVRREILSWYDERGSRYYTAEETAQQARQQAELAQQQAAEAIE